MNQFADVQHLFSSYFSPDRLSLPSLFLLSDAQYILGSCLALLCVFLLSLLFAQPRFVEGIPIVPSSSFFVGVADRLLPLSNRFDSHTYVKEIAEKYGPVVQFRLFNDVVVLVTDPVLCKLVLEGVKGKTRLQKNIAGAPTLLTMDTNEEWKKRRQSFRHAFNPLNLQKFDSVLNARVSRLVAKIDDFAASHDVLYIDRLFSRFALDVIFSVGFEMEMNFLDNDVVFEELNNAVQELFKTSSARQLPGAHLALKLHLPFSMLQRYRAADQTLRKYQRMILQHLVRKRANNEFAFDSFGKIFMDFCVENTLSEEEMLAELLIFIIAGHETTSHTLSWMIYSVASYPEIQMRCWQEMKTQQQARILSSSKVPASPPSSSSPLASSLPEYVEAVLKESIRKFPAIGRASSRQVIDDDGFVLPTRLIRDETARAAYPDSVSLPRDTVVMTHFYTLQNSPRNWGPDAHIFRPERWLRENDERLASPAAYMGTDRTLGEKDREPGVSFAPFSFGARHCLGMPMALWEMRAVLAELLLHFRFELADETMLDEEKAMVSDITMKPLNDLPVYVYHKE